MDRIAALLFLYFLAPCALADVYYQCNPVQDYIAIIDAYFSMMEPVAAQAELIPVSDGFPVNGIVRHCRLSSGAYVVTLAAHPIEEQPTGIDGYNRRVTVDIKHNKDIMLFPTVIGRCDIPHPEGAVCKDAWAVEIRLSGRTGRVELVRLIYF